MVHPKNFIVYSSNGRTQTLEYIFILHTQKEIATLLQDSRVVMMKQFEKKKVYIFIEETGELFKLIGDVKLEENFVTITELHICKKCEDYCCTNTYEREFRPDNIDLTMHHIFVSNTSKVCTSCFRKFITQAFE